MSSMKTRVPVIRVASSVALLVASMAGLPACTGGDPAPSNVQPPTSTGERAEAPGNTAPQPAPSASATTQALKPSIMQEVKLHGSWAATLDALGSKKPTDKLALAGLMGPQSMGLAWLSDGRGAVTVVLGTAWLGFPPPADGPNGTLSAKKSFDLKEDVAVAVFSEAPSWKSILVREPVEVGGLYAKVAELAKAEGADLSKPLMFVVEGGLKSTTWVMPDPKRVKGAVTYESLFASAQRGSFPKERGTIVGVIAPEGSPVLPAGQKGWSHLLLGGYNVAGPIEAGTIEPVWTLMLPQAQ